jgi:branched-chain amino acid transport system permease protein
LEIWIQQLVNAVTIGGMYTLVAVGFTLFFGVLRLVNFAHGEVFMFGSFTGHAVFTALAAVGIQNNVIVLTAMFTAGIALSAVLGAGLERFGFKPLRGMPPLLLLVTSLAIGIVIREGVKEFYPAGANPQRYYYPFADQTLRIGGIAFDYTQIALIVVSLLLVYGVHLFVTRTWAGRAMRAASEDQDAARMMGVEVDTVTRNAFLLGSALGAAAGIMDGLYYHSIKFDMGWVMGIKGFTAAVIGGLGNVYGAIFGGYALGLFEVLVVGLVPKGSQYKDVLVFAILILILVFRPSGLLKAPAEKLG